MLEYVVLQAAIVARINALKDANFETVRSRFGCEAGCSFRKSVTHVEQTKRLDNRDLFGATCLSLKGWEMETESVALTHS